MSPARWGGKAGADARVGKRDVVDDALGPTAGRVTDAVVDNPG